MVRYILEDFWSLPETGSTLQPAKEKGGGLFVAGGEGDVGWKQAGNCLGLQGPRNRELGADGKA